MDQRNLQRFCRQLACWAEACIGQGRSPFRKVECSPLLLTEDGLMRPDLVFWVNRDSFMAGGVLILPEKNAEEGVEAGRLCSRALGLRHFVTWAPREVTFWETRGNSTTRCKTLPLPASENASVTGFQDTLNRVMEELKVFSVLGASLPDQLSSHYLANLFRGALEAAHPFLIDSYRIARGENMLTDEALPTEAMAWQKGALTLLRLVALVVHDSLPTACQPEGLERALEFALDTLPAGLRASLQPVEGELPLSLESSVRFHHLFRRLSQLRPGEDRKRTAKALAVLLTHEGPALGGHPIPFQDSGPAEKRLFINYHSPPPETGEIAQVAPPAILAGTALLRDLENLPAIRAQATDLLAFQPPFAPDVISGTLADQKQPSAQQRKALTARLRTSWPTRRLSLPHSAPVWAWEFVHLLGLAGESGLIEVSTPSDWLTATFGGSLFELIKEQFTLKHLGPGPEGMLRLRIVKGSRPESWCTVEGPEGLRRIAWTHLLQTHRSLLRLAMLLPEDLFALLEEGRFRFPTERDWPQGSEGAVYLFSRTSLGRLFWEIVGEGRPLPRHRSLRADVLRQGVPLPADEVLENLRLLPWKEGETLPPTSLLDQELVLWIGGGLTLPPPPSEASRPPGGIDVTGPTLTERELEKEITDIVFADGIPRFPEQYLYDHYRPQLREYSFEAPLTAGEEFFGRITLHDKAGGALEVEGGETARALLLASFSGRTPVALPADRNLTAAILERYLADLRKIRQALARQTHLRIPDTRAAKALGERIWRSSPLPPWDLVDP